MTSIPSLTIGPPLRTFWDPRPAVPTQTYFSAVPPLPVTTAGFHPLFRPPEPRPPVVEALILSLAVFIGWRLLRNPALSFALPFGQGGSTPEAGIGLLLRIGKKITDARFIKALRDGKGVEARVIARLRISKERFQRMRDALMQEKKYRRLFAETLPRLRGEAREEAKAVAAAANTARRKVTDRAIADAIRRAKGVYTAAARLLKINKGSLSRLVRRAPAGSLLARTLKKFPIRHRRGEAPLGRGPTPFNEEKIRGDITWRKLLAGQEPPSVTEIWSQHRARMTRLQRAIEIDHEIEIVFGWRERKPLQEIARSIGANCSADVYEWMKTAKPDSELARYLTRIVRIAVAKVGSNPAKIHAATRLRGDVISEYLKRIQNSG